MRPEVFHPDRVLPWRARPSRSAPPAQHAADEDDGDSSRGLALAIIIAGLLWLAVAVVLWIWLH